MAALGRLSPEHRVVLVLKELEGQKYEDIAAVLDVPIGTVRSRLHRARLELRDLLHREE
jgi:RNA polymerase sigma-70 factor (ECF subfamily)